MVRFSVAISTNALTRGGVWGPLEWTMKSGEGGRANALSTSTKAPRGIVRSGKRA